MKQSLTRRLLAGAAGLAIGAAGMVAFATPASATNNDDQNRHLSHKQAEVGGEAVCDEETGVTEVAWTVGNTSRLQATISEVILTVNGEVVEGAVVEGLEVDTLVIKDEPITVTQAFEPGTATVELSVTLRWAWEEWSWPHGKVWKEHTDTGAVEVGCELPPPPPPPPPAGADIIVVFTCDLVVFLVDNELGDTDSLVTLTPNQAVTTGPANGFSYVVHDLGDGEQEIEIITEEGAGMGEPTAEADGDNPVEVGPVTAGSFTAQAFEASDGLEITVDLAYLIEGENVPQELDDPVVVWDDEGLDCEPEGEGGELPVTGASTGLIALGAVVLLAVGGGLFLIARRRRVTFTA